MLNRNTPMSLSGNLAIRMVAISVSISLLLTFIFFLHYIADTPGLREATLHANALAIGKALSDGKDPAKLPLYRDYPKNYGFRVFDRRNLATRHILAAANTRWLPAVQHLTATDADPDRGRDMTAVGTDLLDSFNRFHPKDAQTPGDHLVSLLIYRVVVAGRKYWVQVYMIGDPAWAWLSVIDRKLISHVFFPVIFIVPALTLAMFVSTRAALRPLRRLSTEANQIGAAVAKGQALVPVSGTGMAKEFADVAGTINLMLAKLEKSLRVQKQFTSDVAHELRTPLAVLMLEVSQLPQGSARESIKKDLQDLGELVNELLRFAQAEDIMSHEMSDVDVVAVARKVCEEAVGKAVAERKTIEFDCASPCMVIAGNVALIEIAIRNLIENALKYSPADSTVAVWVEEGPVVIVGDRGPGIPADQRDIVFERFWRADRQARSGAGVGLALVRRIAQLHDGNIMLEERQSGGTRAVLRLGRRISVRKAIDLLSIS